MTKTTQEIIHDDLVAWANDQLQDWVSDVAMRFEAADQDPINANAAIGSLALGLISKLIARTTTVPAKEVGDVLANMIRAERGRMRQRERKESHK